MKKLQLLLIATLFISVNVFAQGTKDIEGSKDYPTISRFENSIIEFYKETKWGSYKLPVSDKGTIDWSEPKILEGKVIRTQHTTSIDNNSEFVLHNYKAAFNKSGFVILTIMAGTELNIDNRPYYWWSKYYGSGGYYNGINNGKFGMGITPHMYKNHSLIVAKGHSNNKDIYAIIYITEDKDDKYTLITQDVIEVEAVETGLVTAQSLDDGLTINGHITLDGLYFNTGESTIKPESAEALKNIAEYLNTHPAKRFLVVGNTDNVGDFNANLKLSKDRAEAVMNELLTKYSVKTEQLKAYGIGSASPVVSNSTDEGKAKNRRVEIVEQ